MFKFILKIIDYFFRFFWSWEVSDFWIAVQSAAEIASTTTLLSDNLSASDAVSATVALASPTPLDLSCSGATPLASKAATT